MSCISGLANTSMSFGLWSGRTSRLRRLRHTPRSLPDPILRVFFTCQWRCWTSQCLWIKFPNGLKAHDWILPRIFFQSSVMITWQLSQQVWLSWNKSFQSCSGEAGTVRQLTYRQLYAEVAACSKAMRNLGITVGDRVAAYIPNCAEAVIAMLATASIGAIWSSTSPDFGATVCFSHFLNPFDWIVKGVLDRFQQTEPKLLFSVNAVNYNGKVHDHFPKLKSVADELPSLQKVIVIPFVESTAMPDLNLFGQHW